MLTVDEYTRIRQAHRDGMSIRAIGRTFHHSRRKVREVLMCPEPKPYFVRSGGTSGEQARRLSSYHPANSCRR